MTESLPYQMEDSKKPYNNKPLKVYQKAKGMSFFAFVFSVFVYISIFYIFNLSPSTLFKTSKFWFLISNTLILILAVDYGAFSSSKQDVYDEYFAHSEAKRVAIVHHEQKSMHVEEQEKNDGKLVTSQMQIVPIIEDVQEKRIVHVNDHDHQSNILADVKPIISTRRRYRRTKSEKVKRSVVIDETKNKVVTLRRSETEKRQEIEDCDHFEESNEYSNMSDEDLNRRVEEFIQRFNKQIRLQARNDRNLLEY